MNDLTLTNVSLAILAGVSLLEFVMLVVLGVWGHRMYKATMAILITAERVHLAPLHARADALLDQAQVIIDDVAHVQQSVSRVVRTANDTGQFIAAAVSARTRPVTAALRAVQILRQRRRNSHAEAETMRLQSGL